MKEIVQAEEDIWAGDLLGRKAEGQYLRRYIERLYDVDRRDQTSFVLNINSEWGHGKTWFLKNLSRELRQNHPVVYFDAWKNDFSNDALLSFVSVVCDELSKLFWKDKPISQKIIKVKSIFSSLSKSALPILLSVLAKQLTGKALDDLGLSEEIKDACVDASDELSKVVSTSAIDSFLTQRNAISDFSNAVQSLVEEISKKPSIKLPICIMVDELDRCRPTYAIELLEAIKHLFSINGVFFILATDTRQLSHSIKAVYGNEFDAHSYLKRFFYAEYILCEPDYKSFSNYLFSLIELSEKFLIPSEWTGKIFFASVAKLFKLSVRDQEQVFDMLVTIIIVGGRDDLHLPLLLWLIVLRVKVNDAYVTFKNKVGFLEHVNLFKELVDTGKCLDVGLNAKKLDSKNEVISLVKVIEWYIKIDTADPRLVGISELDEKCTFFYQREVLKTFSRGELRNYFALVEQAGRVVVRNGSENVGPFDTRNSRS